MTEWRPSGPEPAKDAPGILSMTAQISINRPEIRNRPHPGTPFELPNTPGAPVIILTARSPGRP